jgi:tol-pal system protein YbgF
MTRSSYPSRIAVIAALAALLLAGTAMAQDQRSQPGLFDNLFNRGEQPSQQRQAPPREAPPDPSDLTVRIDRLENALRQLTGTIEQLQYQNQQLQSQLQQMRSMGGAAPGPAPGPAPGAPVNAPPAARPGNRSDVFDPAQRPNAPGAPRVLGNMAAIAAPEQPAAPNQNQIPNQNPADEPPVGAPGGRNAGAPLDLATMAGNPPPPLRAPDQEQRMDQQAAPQVVSQPASQLPPPRSAVPAPVQLATLPPTASPQDEYDMAYGYVLHKDYALAEQAFRDFVKKYPNDRLVPDAQYWLGESLFQRQRYRDAAESFLAVSTKFDKAGKAPDSLLRLGQSLAALNQKEAACATLAEVGRKFPRASGTVKRGVEQEQKRAHC